MSSLSEYLVVVDMTSSPTENSVATANGGSSFEEASSPAESTASTSSGSKRKSSSLPSETVEYLKNWMMSPQHIHHPYPSEAEKLEIIKETGITMKQLTNWFVNNRKRYWRPRVEARLQQQAQAAAVAAHAHAAVAAAVKVAAAQQQQVQPTLRIAPSPVSPETNFKPALSVPTPSASAFVSFLDNTPRATATSPLLQQQQQYPTLQPQTNTATTIDATKAVEMLLAQVAQQTQTPPPSLQTSGEVTMEPVVPQSVPPTVSESEMSDCSSDKDESVVVYTSFEKDVRDKASTYARTVSMGSLDKLDVASLTPEALNTSVPTTLVTPTKKRSRIAARAVTPQRQKFRRVSFDLWKDACSKASDFQDENLPSFEEASRLFGFTNRLE